MLVVVYTDTDSEAKKTYKEVYSVALLLSLAVLQTYKVNADANATDMHRNMNVHTHNIS